MRIAKPLAMRGWSLTSPSSQSGEITTMTTGRFPWPYWRVSPFRCGDIRNGCTTSTRDGAVQLMEIPTIVRSLMFSPTLPQPISPITSHRDPAARGRMMTM